ncbi:hypothetical protein Moror_15533, partial [Moniliophthora roreri MCA 2997]
PRVREAVQPLLIFYHHNVGDETKTGYIQDFGGRKAEGEGGRRAEDRVLKFLQPCIISGDECPLQWHPSTQNRSISQVQNPSRKRRTRLTSKNPSQSALLALQNPTRIQTNADRRIPLHHDQGLSPASEYAQNNVFVAHVVPEARERASSAVLYQIFESGTFRRRRYLREDVTLCHILSFSLTTTTGGNELGRDVYWLREVWKEAGEGGRTAVEQGGRYQDRFSISSDAYATHRRRRYPRIAAISRNATPAKVNVSLNTDMMSLKTRDIVLVSISTPAPPLPPTLASGLKNQHPNPPG